MAVTSSTRFGSVRDAHDPRDFNYVPVAQPAVLPAQVDLRRFCGESYDQLPLQSCSAHAFGSLLTFVANVEGRPMAPPSRLFIYCNARKLDGTFPADTGATMRNAMKSVVQSGACNESLWPYDVDKASQEPPADCYTPALHERAHQYFRIAQDIDHLRNCLAQGYAFVFGMQAYIEGFTSAQHSGIVPLPGPNERPTGGHAVMAVGYDDTAQTFLVLNSLGPSWGMQGYFTLPYAYLLDPKLSYDFWTIRSVG